MFRMAKSLEEADLKVDFYSYSGLDGKKIKTRIPTKLLALPFFRDMFICPFIGRRLLHKLALNYDMIILASPMLVSLVSSRVKFIAVTHAIRTQKML